MATYPFGFKGGAPGVTLQPSGDTTGATDLGAIQGAINTLSSGGGIVYLSAGTFYTSSLTLASGVSLVGAGRTATIVQAAGISSAAILTATISTNNAVFADITVQDLTLNGVTGPGGTVTGIHFDTTAFATIDYHGITFERVQFENLLYGWTFAALQGNTALPKDSVIVHNCRFVNDSVGASLGGTYGIQFHGCHFTANTVAAIGSSNTFTIPNTGGSGDQAWTLVEGCSIQGLGNLTGAGGGTESGIVFQGSSTAIVGTYFAFISQYPMWLQANEGIGNVVSGVTVCQTGGTVMRLDNDQISAGSGVVSNVFISFACQNAALNNGALISIEGGTWDLADITVSSASGGGSGTPANVYALMLGQNHKVYGCTVARYNCQTFTGSWLGPVGGPTNILSNVQGVIIKDSPGFNPSGTQAVNVLTANDSSFEGGVGSFTGFHCTLASSTSQALYGTHSLALTSTGSALIAALSSDNTYTASAGQLWTAYASFRANTTVRDVEVQIQFYTSGGALLLTVYGTNVNDTSTGWTQAWVMATAPATTGFVAVNPVVGRFGGSANGEIHYVDGVGLYQGAILETWGIGGLTTGSVPATTVATAVAYTDRTYYITAGAGGATTAVVSGGPTVTVPASACVPVFVPAGQTLTPTYTSAPTWVVEGN